MDLQWEGGEGSSFYEPVRCILSCTYMISSSSMLYVWQYIPHLHRRKCYVLSADRVGSAYYSNFSIKFNLSSELVGLTFGVSTKVRVR